MTCNCWTSGPMCCRNAGNWQPRYPFSPDLPPDTSMRWPWPTLDEDAIRADERAKVLAEIKEN